MSVTVAWEGITLADGVEGRSTEVGLFVPLSAPMPVGTIVRVVLDGRTHEAAVARVARVQESGEIGVLLVGESGALLSSTALAEPPRLTRTEEASASEPPQQPAVEAGQAAAETALLSAKTASVAAETASSLEGPLVMPGVETKAAPGQASLSFEAQPESPASSDSAAPRESDEEGEQRDFGSAGESSKNGDPDKSDDKKGRRRRRKSKA